jgi:DNA polymerase-3 subunit delta
MTPEQFLRALDRQGPAAAYLFIGPETFRRRACRQALIEKVLGSAAGGEAFEAGFVRHDLDSAELVWVLDDARSMSLFAPRRLIWVSAAEGALPRGRAAAEDEEKAAPAPGTGAADLLGDYAANPPPGVVLVFDSSRYGFDGDDKARSERVRKFYSAVKEVVEFAPLAPAEARDFVKRLARERGLELGADEVQLLVEVTAADSMRLATEVEKLALFAAARGGRVTQADIAALAPDAAETTIFSLVNALARRERAEALDLLGLLAREGEYLPVALTLLGGIFRLALAAQELNLNSTAEVQSYFHRRGTPMWPSRAEQVWRTGRRFSRAKLEEAIQLVFQADRDLKGIRADDRVVMENFVFRLT